MFVEQPMVLLAVLFHDCKFERSHDRFVETLQREIPTMPKYCVLITDGEDALKNAFRSHYPALEQLRCWNHLGKNVKAAAKKYYVPAKQILIDTDENHSDSLFILTKSSEIVNQITDTVMNLLRAPSKRDFMNQYESISPLWSSKFNDWFTKNLLSIIDEAG